MQGPGGVLYFTTNNPGLGRITTSGEILPFVAPDNTLANGSGIAAHGDDVWYADFNNDSLWRYDTTTGNFTQFPVPEPSDVAVDEDGIVWFAATSDQAIGRLDPATGDVTLTPTDTLVPRGITVAADGDVWFSARFVPRGSASSTRTRTTSASSRCPTTPARRTSRRRPTARCGSPRPPRAT